MPTIAVDKANLYKALGREYTEKEFDELCFDFGLELDEDTTDTCEPGEEPQLKIEVPANRYDLLCFEGIARALNIFLGRAETPTFKLSGKPQYTIEVDPDTQHVRQYAAGAVLRGVKFDQKKYDSFISLQDKLHANLCRNRSLVAIGTHDLRTVQGTKIRYEARKPEDIKFVPLKQSRAFNAKELMEFYENDRQLNKFLHIIRDAPKYPAFYDESDQVLSMPPIINSERTKITQDTTDVFIDVTATDKTKIEIVVNQMVAMFSEYCSEPFTVEPVEIISPHNNESRICPDLSPRQTTAEVDYVKSCPGIDISKERMCELLAKMSLTASPSKTDDNLLDVSIPITRPDILHQCDIMEDVAVAYGFNNLARTFPANSYTIGDALPVNKVTDILRKEGAMCGWAEVLLLTLCSHDENFAYLRKQDDGKTAVQLANPKTLEYQVVRTSLLPGLLKTIRENRRHALPMKIFEAGDVVLKDETVERQAVNLRRFGSVYCGKTSGFEIVQGLLDRLMKMLRLDHIDIGANERGYWIDQNNKLGTFLPNRGYDIYFREAKDHKPKIIGNLGILHPEVLSKFEIPFVASSLELDLDVFVL